MVSNHLKKATEGYNLEEKFIHPISEMDAELVSILIDIIEQRGWTDLSDILKDYKKLSDEDILDTLAEYSVNIDDDDIDEEQPSKKGSGSPKEFVSIGDYTFRTFALFTFRRVSRWVEHGLIHCLIVNEGPLPGSAQWYVDTLIDFESEDVRDKEWSALQSKMKKQNCVFL